MQLDEEPDGVHCRLAGRLTGERCAEIREALADLGPVRVAEVSELGVVEEAGLELLEELRRAGAELRGLSPYLSLRLGVHEKSSGPPTTGSGSRDHSKSNDDEAEGPQGENG